MSVVAGLGKAAGAEVLVGARPANGRVYSKTKKALVVLAGALLVLIAFAALIPASEAPNAGHSHSAASTPDQPVAAAPRFPQSLRRRLR